MATKQASSGSVLAAPAVRMSSSGSGRRTKPAIAASTASGSSSTYSIDDDRRAEALDLGAHAGLEPFACDRRGPTP